MEPHELNLVAWIVAVGDVFGDGLTFYGPFNLHEDAMTFAEDECSEEGWRVLPLYEPDTGVNFTSCQPASRRADL